MAILVDAETRVITQGFTGQAGHVPLRAGDCLRHQDGRGVTPGKGGSRHLDLPVFDTVWEARERTGATATAICVPPTLCRRRDPRGDRRRIPLIVCITEGIPVLDMVRVKRALTGSHSRLIGPNCPGVITPDACKIGIMPGHIHARQRRHRVTLRHADL